MEIKVGVHEKLYDFEYLNIVVSSVFDKFVIFYSNVYIRQLFSVSVVEVTQFDPSIHYAQRNLLVFFFVL